VFMLATRRSPLWMIALAPWWARSEVRDARRCA
jgi:hypothetical protein